MNSLKSFSLGPIERKRKGGKKDRGPGTGGVGEVGTVQKSLRQAVLGCDVSGVAPVIDGHRGRSAETHREAKLLLDTDKPSANLRLPALPSPQRNENHQGQPGPLGEGMEQSKRPPSCSHLPACTTSYLLCTPGPHAHTQGSLGSKGGALHFGNHSVHFLFLYSSPPVFISSLPSSPLCPLGVVLLAGPQPGPSCPGGGHSPQCRHLQAQSFAGMQPLLLACASSCDSTMRDRKVSRSQIWGLKMDSQHDLTKATLPEWLALPVQISLRRGHSHSLSPPWNRKCSDKLPKLTSAISIPRGKSPKGTVKAKGPSHR